MKKVEEGAFVAWSPYTGRTQGFIDILNLEPIYIHYLGFRRPVYAPLKYGPQFIVTLFRLIRLRPEVIFVTVPPVFAAMAVHLYCLFSDAIFIMDCHSGAFESNKWRWSLPILKYFSCRAAAVIVTNTYHQKLSLSFGAKSVIISDPLPKLISVKGKLPKPCKVKNIVAICSFGADEPIDEIIEAANRSPEICFYITGDIKRASPRWVKKRESNITFTGWLSNDEFWWYLQNSNAILTLTRQENTILRGGWEAMFLGQPLITSSSQTMRDYFSSGTIFVENTGESIAKGIRSAMEQENKLRLEMKALMKIKRFSWFRELQLLEELIGREFSIVERINPSVIQAK